LCAHQSSDHASEARARKQTCARLGRCATQAYERGADGKRSWWRRALELFGTFRRKHGDILTRGDFAEYRKQKAREELPVTDPERHLGLRVSRLEDLAKGLVVGGDVDLNDLGDNADIKDEESGAEANTGYSILTPNEARNHERPNHLRLFQEGCEPRSFRDRLEDPEHIARSRRGDGPSRAPAPCICRELTRLRVERSARNWATATRAPCSHGPLALDLPL
jgi:hypothetical protein